MRCCGHGEVRRVFPGWLACPSYIHVWFERMVHPSVRQALKTTVVHASLLPQSIEQKQTRRAQSRMDIYGYRSLIINSSSITQ
eukprot:4753918-Pleurochrysis_carterae.AAC.1